MRYGSFSDPDEPKWFDELQVAGPEGPDPDPGLIPILTGGLKGLAGGEGEAVDGRGANVLVRTSPQFYLLL